MQTNLATESETLDSNLFIIASVRPSENSHGNPIARNGSKFAGFGKFHPTQLIRNLNWSSKIQFIAMDRCGTDNWFISFVSTGVTSVDIILVFLAELKSADNEQWTYELLRQVGESFCAFSEDAGWDHKLHHMHTYTKQPTKKPSTKEKFTK